MLIQTWVWFTLHVLRNIYHQKEGKKWSPCLKKCLQKKQMCRTFQWDSAFLTLSKWNLFQTYTPWLLTLTMYKYLNLIFLDTFSDLLLTLTSSLKFVVSIFHDVMHISDILWQILQIREISSKCLHNLLLFKEIFHQNNESLLILTHLRRLNVWEFTIQSFSFFLMLDTSFIHIFTLFLEPVESCRQIVERSNFLWFCHTWLSRENS